MTGHGLGAGRIRNPPVAGISSVVAFDEMKDRISSGVTVRGYGKIIIAGNFSNVSAAPLHRLDQHQILHDMLATKIKPEPRVTQMGENAPDEHQVDPLAQYRKPLYGQN